jgi:transcriptional regulator with XRE-family HTH domain
MTKERMAPSPAPELLASMSPDELGRHMRKLGYRTQSDLAAAIGVSRSAVSLWLEGKVGVPRPVAMLLRMLVAAQRRAF